MVQAVDSLSSGFRKWYDNYYYLHQQQQHQLQRDGVHSLYRDSDSMLSGSSGYNNSPSNSNNMLRNRFLDNFQSPQQHGNNSKRNNIDSSGSSDSTTLPPASAPAIVVTSQYLHLMKLQVGY